MVIESRLKEIPGEVGVLELVRVASKDWEKDLVECIERGKKNFSGDFYIVILIKKEKLFDEVFRLLFFARVSCPTPTYDQIVYRYIRNSEQLDFLWVVPDKDTCHYYHQNALEVDEEERDLLGFVLDFYSGELDKKAQILNNERPDQEHIILVSS